jgi:hemerythrin-like metal-binding protein
MFGMFKGREGADADLMPWSDDYNTGIKAIDDDHKSLFSAANHLNRAVKRREGRQVIEGTFNMLMKYIHEHFAREEQLMSEAGYVGFEEHKRLHMIFMSAFFTTKQSYTAAPRQFDFDAFLKFLKNWLEHHVLVEDIKYVPHVRSGKH